MFVILNEFRTYFTMSGCWFHKLRNLTQIFNEQKHFAYREINKSFLCVLVHICSITKLEVLPISVRYVKDI